MNAGGVLNTCKSNEVHGSLLPEDLVANGCVTREKPVPDSGITVGNDC